MRFRDEQNRQLIRVYDLQPALSITTALGSREAFFIISKTLIGLRITTKLEEERLLNPFEIHHTQQGIVIDETKCVVDRQIVVDHCGTDFPPILHHTHTRFCLTSLQHKTCRQQCLA